MASSPETKWLADTRRRNKSNETQKEQVERGGLRDSAPFTKPPVALRRTARAC